MRAMVSYSNPAVRYWPSGPMKMLEQRTAQPFMQAWPVAPPRARTSSRNRSPSMFFSFSSS